MATGAIDTGTEQLLCEVRDRVALITLNRPESRNALGDTLRRRCDARYGSEATIRMSALC